jgi:hypothetical protein
MYFYAIVFISILLPLVLKNKKLALRISFFFLFILLGFQFELVADWGPNIGRWQYVNEGAGEGALGTAIKMGPVFMWLLKVLKPITFYGWLMLSAASFLFLIYKFTRYYVSPRYYWLTILTMMLNVEYAPLIINSNRQCISMIFVLVGVLFLLGNFNLDIKIPFFPKKLNQYIFCISFLFLGSQCHSAAYLSFLLVPIYFLARKYNGNNWIILAVICDFIFLGRIFLNTSWIQNYVSVFSAALNIGDTDYYTEWFDNQLIDISISYTFVYCVIIALIAYCYRKMNFAMKFFSLSWYIGWTIASYFTGNINRLGEYFYIFGLFVIPYMFSYIISMKGNLKKYIGILCLLLFIGYTAAHSWTQMNTIYYERWLDYKSVFDAPRWE